MSGIISSDMITGGLVMMVVMIPLMIWVCRAYQRQCDDSDEQARQKIAAARVLVMMDDCQHELSPSALMKLAECVAGVRLRSDFEALFRANESRDIWKCLGSYVRTRLYEQKNEIGLHWFKSVREVYADYYECYSFELTIWSFLDMYIPDPRIGSIFRDPFLSSMRARVQYDPASLAAGVPYEDVRFLEQMFGLKEETCRRLWRVREFCFSHDCEISNLAKNNPRMQQYIKRTLKPEAVSQA